MQFFTYLTHFFPLTISISPVNSGKNPDGQEIDGHVGKGGGGSTQRISGHLFSIFSIGFSLIMTGLSNSFCFFDFVPDFLLLIPLYVLRPYLENMGERYVWYLIDFERSGCISLYPGGQVILGHFLLVAITKYEIIMKTWRF